MDPIHKSHVWKQEELHQKKSLPTGPEEIILPDHIPQTRNSAQNITPHVVSFLVEKAAGEAQSEAISREFYKDFVALYLKGVARALGGS